MDCCPKVLPNEGIGAPAPPKGVEVGAALAPKDEGAALAPKADPKDPAVGPGVAPLPKAAGALEPKVAVDVGAVDLNALPNPADVVPKPVDAAGAPKRPVDGAAVPAAPKPPAAGCPKIPPVAGAVVLPPKAVLPKVGALGCDWEARRIQLHAASLGMVYRSQSLQRKAWQSRCRRGLQRCLLKSSPCCQREAGWMAAAAAAATAVAVAAVAGWTGLYCLVAQKSLQCGKRSAITSGIILLMVSSVQAGPCCPATGFAVLSRLQNSRILYKATTRLVFCIDSYAISSCACVDASSDDASSADWSTRCDLSRHSSPTPRTSRPAESQHRRSSHRRHPPRGFPPPRSHPCQP